MMINFLTTSIWILLITWVFLVDILRPQHQIKCSYLSKPFEIIHKKHLYEIIWATLVTWMKKFHKWPPLVSYMTVMRLIFKLLNHATDYSVILLSKHQTLANKLFFKPFSLYSIIMYNIIYSFHLIQS